MAVRQVSGPWRGEMMGLPDDRVPGPCPHFRREFDVRRPLRAARLLVTGLGAVEVRLNGERVGDEWFSPGWTDYRKRLQFRVHDVTPLVRPGRNAIGLIVGPGWYGGPMPGRPFKRFAFGAPPVKARILMDLEYVSGKPDHVGIDGDWRGAFGPILLSETYTGERYDARLEMPGWDRPGFDDAGWKPVTLYDPGPVELVPQDEPPIRVTQEIAPVSVREQAPGAFVFDMGQNMAGVCRLEVSGPAGTVVKLRHGEVLNPDGTIHTENLRAAEATDTYTLRGGGREVYTPRFTYHGFRYVEMTGFPGTPDPTALTGLVLHTDAPPAGTIATSSPLVNKIVENIRWGLRGNLHSVMTDCPQRDERLGWMGDANIVAPTACYLMDLSTFLPKFVQDMADAQREYGSFTDVSPMVSDWAIPADGAPGWADAGVVVPWVAYRFYGDQALLRRHWEPVRRFVDYVIQHNPDGAWANRRGNDYGDWVPAGGQTDRTALATLIHLNTCDLAARWAQVIGKEADAHRLLLRHRRVRKAFRKAWCAGGRIRGGSQTLYALALHYGVFDPVEKVAAVGALAADIEARGDHLSTGFLGTPVLLPALSDGGRHDLALKLLLNRDYPSWGYMVAKGATTIWELWNSDTAGPDMNSRNHLAYGSVGEWIFGWLAGIRPAEPGFRRVLIHPHPGAPGSELTRLTARYRSIRGPIEVEWRVTADSFLLRVDVPPKTSAVVVLPDGSRVSARSGSSSYRTAAIPATNA
jgi:alpha-L-rhamnosidase